jgi:hypothetical protein
MVPAVNMDHRNQNALATSNRPTDRKKKNTYQKGCQQANEMESSDFPYVLPSRQVMERRPSPDEISPGSFSNVA